MIAGGGRGENPGRLRKPMSVLLNLMSNLRRTLSTGDSNSSKFFPCCATKFQTCDFLPPRRQPWMVSSCQEVRNAWMHFRPFGRTKSVLSGHALLCTYKLCAHRGFARLHFFARTLSQTIIGAVRVVTAVPREERQRGLEHVGNEGQGSQIPQEVLEELYPLR